MITDVMGVSGRAMLRALVEGTTDPVVLANLARGRLREKLPDLRRALQGRFRPHHAFLIEQILAKIDFLDDTVDRVTTEIDRRLSQFEPMLAALDTIPGIDRIGAISIVAETGGDIVGFPPPPTCVAGRRCVRVRTRVPANGAAGRRVKATATCVAPWSKRVWQPAAATALRSRRGTVA